MSLWKKLFGADSSKTLSGPPSPSEPPTPSPANTMQASIAAEDRFDYDALARQSRGDLSNLVKLLTEASYSTSSKQLEQAVADLLDKHGKGDAGLRDLARLVRLRPNERQIVRRERERARHTLDLRSASQIVHPLKKGPLRPELENIAWRLAELIPDRGSDEPPAGVETAVRTLGEQAYSIDGIQAMYDIWFRIEGIGGRGDFLSSMWDKLHTWRQGIG